MKAHDKPTVEQGTRLIEDKFTSPILKEYREFFELNQETTWSKEYILIKEPSPELTSKIEAYYEVLRVNRQKMEVFIDKVAKDVLENLSQESKDYIFSHPDSTTHHFGMGLGIRNKYIHGKDIDIDFDYVDPDGLSSRITERIAALLIGYDYDNPFYIYFYSMGNFPFSHLRRMYYALKGEYPDAMMARYAERSDYEEAAKEVREIIKKEVINIKRFKQLCEKYGLSEKKYKECKTIIDEHNKETWRVVPYDIALLTSKKLEPEVRERLLRTLEAVLKDAYTIRDKLPTYIFNQKDAALSGVRKSGKLLKRMSKFNDDNDVIRAAIKNNGEAIRYVRKEVRDNPEYVRLALSDEHARVLRFTCMKKYRDDEQFVKIALKTNGCNIEFASKRLRDDIEMARIAVTHQKSFCPADTVCNLSARLRNDLEIALLDIRKGHACVESYSKKLRDSDEVAKELIASGNEDRLYKMSERIRKKYDVMD